jgi:hypothetical protein
MKAHRSMKAVEKINFAALKLQGGSEKHLGGRNHGQ